MFFYVMALILSLLAILIGGRVILTAEPIAYFLDTGLPFTLVSFTVDSLSAFFMLIIGLIALAVSAYAIGYIKEFEGKKSIHYLGGMYNLFLIFMFGVVSADNIFTFLFMWEAMSITSYFLVMYQYEKQDVRNAGFIYLVMAHIGAIFIFASLFLLAFFAAGISYSDLRANSTALAGGAKSIVFLLAVIGFGSKSGIVPLHVWLPRAHPAAPGPISAIMSAVMLKTGAYGLIRIIFEFTGTPFAWWGVLLLIIGSASALFGILRALMETDLKRLLAYSSVENMGVIYLGLGAATLLLAYSQPLFASFALLAALIHLLNHSFFKGLLFMGTGAVMQATGEKNMEKLGGLIKTMPWTAAMFLTGAVAIAALPPLNGFVGEWLTIQALLLVLQHTSGIGIQILITLIAVALIFTSALVVVCFVKAFGITFLAKPRSKAAQTAREVSFPMRAGMSFLALGCFVLGIGAPVAIKGITPVVGSLIAPSYQLESNWLIPAVSLQGAAMQLSLALLLVLLLALILLSMIFIPLVGGKAKRQPAKTWGCGIDLQPQMTYSGVSLVQPLQSIFEWFFRNRGQWARPPHEYFEDIFYRPLKVWAIKGAEHLRRIQNGNMQLYLGYIFVALLLLLTLQLR